MNQPTLTFRLMRSMCAWIALLLSLLPAVTASAGGRVVDVAGFPSAEPGYSLGVSAGYAGRIGDYIIMAGGCNFPEEGKPKKYYSGIYAARIDSSVLRWRLVGSLPEPAAYGGTVQSGDSLLFIGGNNSEHSLRTVYGIRLGGEANRAEITRLADLPCTVDNMAVAQTGTDVYVVGGNQDGRPSASVLRLSLDKTKPVASHAEDAACSSSPWREVARVPGKPRVQPVAVAHGDKLYVWGGFFADGESSVVHTGGYSLAIDREQWETIAAPRSAEGEEMTLAGGIAWTDGNRVFATGGVNKDIFLDAISGRYERVRQEDYQRQPVGWYKFGGNLYEYDTTANHWIATTFSSPSLARAGAQAVSTPIGTLYIGGELKPALRTPQIVLLSVESL